MVGKILSIVGVIIIFYFVGTKAYGEFKERWKKN